MDREDGDAEAWRHLVDDLVSVDRVVAGDVTAGTTLLPVHVDLLIRLGGAPDRRSPMNVVANAMRVSGSSLTKLVDKLSDLGLAQREASPDDRRVVYVVLTEAGAAEAARLRARYAAAVRARVLRVLDSGVLDLAATSQRLTVDN